MNTPASTPCPVPIEHTSSIVQRHAGADAPMPLRLMAAKGLAPMSPQNLVTTQFILTFDTEAKVADAAINSLSSLDPRIAKAVLPDAELNPAVLGHLSLTFATNDTYIEPLMLNPATPTAVFEEVAGVCSEPIAELIAQNQARLLVHPDIVRGLTKNPQALRSSIDRCVDFLVRSGIILDGMPEFESALMRLDEKDRLAAVQNVEIPPDLLDEKLLKDTDTLPVEEEEDEASRLDKLPLDEKLRRLPLPALVAYATKGNKQVRKTLLRHNNRLVALAAITSPMIQEPEVVEASQSKVTHQDVIAHIAKDKKNNWVRIYQVKLGLVNNPKTPLTIAMRLVPLLTKKDIRALARSKNIPVGVRTLATRLAKSGG